jgi:hypothetical protein
MSALSWFRGRYIMGLLGLIVIVCGVRVIRARRDLVRLSRFLNVVTAAMVLVTVVEILVRIEKAGKVPAGTAVGKTMALKLPVGTSPDLYYIILDAYTSNESLREFWNYDNTPFSSLLESNRFTVVRDAHSNFNYTFLSVASALTMDYPPLVTNMFRKFCRETFGQAAVPRALQNAGYDFINLSLFDVAGQPNFYSYAAFSPGSLAKLLMHDSLVGLLWERLHSQSMAEINLRIIAAVEGLAATKANRPRFVYAHLMMPHDPYVFDRNGNRVPGNVIRDEKTAYFEQLLFVNKVITNLVPTIQRNASVPPIIVVQGDHGFRWLGGESGKRESLTILNAYYLPNSSPDWVYDGITPVNTFRLIFNHYFGTHYEYLPDRSRALLLERGGMEL